MQKIPVYHVDAFTDKIFHGNPAAVCILTEWLDENSLHLIAKENNLPVTAFLLRKKDIFEIRWITPEIELDLCGHGSHAAAFVIFNFLEPSVQKIDLRSRTELLQVIRDNDYFTLNFPVKDIEKVSVPLLEEGLGLSSKEVYQHSNERLMTVLESEDEVKKLAPNFNILKKLEHRGITVTAKGNSVDFVSRTFYPQKNIAEDPVTGASHCMLAPYWSEQLNKQELHALQVSERGGELFCRVENNRALIKGHAMLYMQGIIHVGLINCRPKEGAIKLI
jgi:PhzF family phenazine biosynthesis protein